MSPASGSVAVTAAPTGVPAGEFSSTLRDTVSAGKLGSVFSSTSMSVTDTATVSSTLLSAAPVSSRPSDTVISRL